MQGSTRKLSPQEQERGRRRYHWFNSLNALSYISVADNILFLFALGMGCPGYIIPVMASFLYFGHLAMPLGKMMTSRFGAAHTVGICWFGRNTSALFTAFAPLGARWFGQEAGIAMILLGSLGFYASRSAGVVATNPLVGEITEPGNRGRFTAQLFQNFQIFSLLWLTVLIFIMRYHPSLHTYQAIIVFGAAMGLVAGLAAYSVPESGMPRLSANISLIDSLRSAAANRRGRRLIFANCALCCALVMVGPVSMAALKQGYHISDSTALLFVLIQYCGGILIAFFSSMLMQQSGPRPIIIISFATALFSCLLWLAAPTGFHWYYVLWIFLLNGIGSCGGPLAVTYYFLNIVTERERVGYSLFLSLTAGAAAGLCSTVIGSGLLKLLPYWNLSDIALFKVYFLIIAILLALLMLPVFRLERLRDWNVSQVLGLFFAPRDLRALYLINRLDKPASPAAELEHIELLGSTQSEFSTAKILSYLDSPRYTLRVRALMALRNIPFGDSAIERILFELKNGEFSTAWIAAVICGEHEIRAALPLLRRSLSSEDHQLVARSMVALVQLNDAESLPEVERMFRESTNPALVLHGAVAMTQLGSAEALRLLLDKSVAPGISRTIRAELYGGIAEIGGYGDEFYKLLKLYRGDEECGPYCLYFLEELSARPLSAAVREQLAAYLRDNDPAPLAATLAAATAAQRDNPHLAALNDFLRDTAPATLGRELLFCLLGYVRRHGLI